LEKSRERFPAAAISIVLIEVSTGIFELHPAHAEVSMSWAIEAIPPVIAKTSIPLSNVFREKMVSRSWKIEGVNEAPVWENQVTWSENKIKDSCVRNTCVGMGEAV
jgi:hypothetical protein